MALSRHKGATGAADWSLRDDPPIKADLEKRGHAVWFDKSEIKAGDDWRRSIAVAAAFP